MYIVLCIWILLLFFFFKKKTAYKVRNNMCGVLGIKTFALPNLKNKKKKKKKKKKKEKKKKKRKEKMAFKVLAEGNVWLRQDSETL